jgi:hypothetical protein
MELERHGLGMSTENQNSIRALREKLGCNWPAIDAARATAQEKRAVLEKAITNPDNPPLPPECSVVVFGSMARDEMTTGSDVDWTLLIDGQADPLHRDVSNYVASQVYAAFKGPNPQGTFGGMAFSHDIVHQIGGQDDTNDNITKRILLLTESRPIGPSGAYERVIRNVLCRYIDDDASFSPKSSKKEFSIPRFLLNDVVRYWRTMAVDYAHKRRARDGKVWAIRNVKLRMSRKLIFVSGILTCYSCHLKPRFAVEKSLFGTKEAQLPLKSHLVHYVEMTPLEILAEALLDHARPDTARTAFDAYDAFLRTTNDADSRKHLETLSIEDAENDPLFSQMLEISHRFQESLTKLFFYDDPLMNTLTVKFGVF